MGAYRGRLNVGAHCPLVPTAGMVRPGHLLLPPALLPTGREPFRHKGEGCVCGGGKLIRAGWARGVQGTSNQQSISGLPAVYRPWRYPRRWCHHSRSPAYRGRLPEVQRETATSLRSHAFGRVCHIWETAPDVLQMYVLSCSVVSDSFRPDGL